MHKGVFSMKLARKLTLKEIIAAREQESKKILWGKAVVANQLAKLSQSRRSRDAAYEAKQRALEAVVGQGWAQVKPDLESEQELLSVQMTRSRRLHALPRDAHRFAG
jgi:hypothetical protein